MQTATNYLKIFLSKQKRKEDSNTRPWVFEAGIFPLAQFSNTLLTSIVPHMKSLILIPFPHLTILPHGIYCRCRAGKLAHNLSLRLSGELDFVYAPVPVISIVKRSAQMNQTKEPWSLDSRRLTKKYNPYPSPVQHNLNQSLPSTPRKCLYSILTLHSSCRIQPRGLSVVV